MYSIRHAAALTGLPVATLRAWERRYGVVQPGRSEAGYRIYDDRDLRLLHAMKALVAAGWSPRLAAEHLRSPAGELDGGTAAELDGGATADLDGGVPPQGSVPLDALCAAGAAHDALAAERALDETLALAPLDAVVDHWLMPALRLLGAGWQDGRVDVAGEHLVSAVVQRRLGAALDAAGRATGAPRALVGLAHGSRHELGILAFAVVLRRAGLDVAYLGADVPPHSWVAATRSHRPAVVVLAAPTRSDVVPVRETVAALAASCPETPVYVGGSAQGEVGGTARPLGHSIRDAVAVLSASVLRR